MVIISMFFIYHLIDFHRNKLAYFSKTWNFNDLIFFIIYTIFFILSFATPDQLYLLKSLQLVIVICGFIKLTFLIRIMTKLSFLVRMLLSVFYELRYFLFFFAIVIGAMTIMLQIVIR